MRFHAVPATMLLFALVACGSAEREEPVATSSDALDVRLEWDGIAFHVECANAGSLNILKVTPTGLEITNEPMVMEVDGSAYRAEVADLDQDGSPEVYVFVVVAGSGSYGSVAAWAANNRKSLSGIHLSGFASGSPESEGYLGHDEFRIEGTRLVRTFPVYREGDPNAAPSGGTRRLEYALVPGEAGWLLELREVSGA